MTISYNASVIPTRVDPVRPRWLTHRWFVPALVLLGMLMVMPTINSGLSMDDFLHWSTLHEGSRQTVHPGSPWGLFHFLTGDAAFNQSLKASGELMWWAADDLRTSFWRPLAEVTHWLDYRWWPRSPALMHLHSVLWYGALVYLLVRLYRVLDTAWPERAKMSALFFVLSSLHLTSVAWIAARNQLVAACFTVACIGAFHVWRMRASPRHGWLAVGLFILALMSAEAGLATMGYLIAHVLVFSGSSERTRQTWRQRLAPLLPFLVVVVVWRVAYNALGYGTAASAFYIDPVGDPVRFLGALMLRLPSLLLAQCLGASSATLSLMTPGQQALYAAAATALVGLCWRVAHGYGLWRSALARFFALGAVLALIPMCASEPTDRLLLTAEIGFSALLAMLLIRVLATHRSHQGWQARLGKVLLGLIAVVHLLIFPLQTVAYASVRKQLVAPPSVLDPLSLPDARTHPNARMVLLNPPVGSMAVYYQAARRYHGISNPKSIQALAHGFHGLRLTVIDARTLELHNAEGKGFLDPFARDVQTHPFTIGETMQVGAMRVTVSALDPYGKPTTVRFQFNAPMSGSAWQFYVWTDTGYAPFNMPAVGQTVSLPAPDLARMLMRQLRGEHGNRIKVAAAGAQPA